MKRKSEHVHRLHIETRGDASVLICASCSRPFAHIEDGHLRITAKHGAVQHENILTTAHVRMMLVEMMRQAASPPVEW